MASRCDATNGDLLWRYRHAIPLDTPLRCGNVNRRVAVAKGKVSFSTLNGLLLALDTRSGQLMWDRTFAEVRSGESATAAPLVVKNMVIVGQLHTLRQKTSGLIVVKFCSRRDVRRACRSSSVGKLAESSSCGGSMKPRILVIMLAVTISLSAVLTADDAAEAKSRLVVDAIGALKMDAVTAAVVETYLPNPDDVPTYGPPSHSSPEESERWLAHQQDARNQKLLLRDRISHRVDAGSFSRKVYYPLIEKTYSKAELEELLAFLKTPAGGKTASLLSQLMREALIQGDVMLAVEERAAEQELARERKQDEYAKAQKSQRTMADMRTFAVAVERYATDYQRYPSPRDIKSSLLPTYLNALVEKDAWGTDILYLITTKGFPQYRIVSAGPDGIFSLESGQIDTNITMSPKASDSDGDDIVYQNGTFVRYPAEAPIDPATTGDFVTLR